MIHTKNLILSIVILMSYTYCFAQNDVAKAMLELDKRMTDYEISKIDTEYFETSQLHHKLFYYDTNNKLRKTVVFYKSGAFQRITNRNTKDESDGLYLEFYENGALKHYGIYINDTGFSYSYYEDGRIKKYSQSKDSYLINYEVSFCSEGELYTEIFYDSTGYSVTGYHCNGNLRVRGRNESDYIKKIGKWEYWNEKGILIKEEFWEKGVLKETKEYDEEGNLIKK